MKKALALVLLGWWAIPVAQAQNYQIISQDLDDSRHGVTVIRVWGSHRDMGHAMGAAFADDILEGLRQIQVMAGANYSQLRLGIGITAWPVPGIADELSGMVAGVKSVRADAMLDETDIKILNTFSDWGYACRSHSCWGRYVQAPVKTLSTRRLDFRTPFPAALHHVLCAWDPSDGSPRFANLAWPGYVAVITGVNEYGTLVSLHDYNSDLVVESGVVPRSIATRLALSGFSNLALPDQLGWAEQELSRTPIATGTFINFYAPEGYAGVFTCPPGKPCGAARRPQPDYLFGEAIMTTNSQTDGHSVAGGGEFMGDYYEQGGTKDLQSHYDLMGHTGMHLLSVAYRGRGDMTIWFEGRSDNGVTPKVALEWSELFPAPAQDGGSDAGPDAGTDAGSDAGLDAGADAALDGGADPGPDAGSDAGADAGADAGDFGGAPSDGGGCGCGAGSEGFGLTLLPILLWVLRRAR
jgi:hypothetical protein